MIVRLIAVGAVVLAAAGSRAATGDPAPAKHEVYLARSIVPWPNDKEMRWTSWLWLLNSGDLPATVDVTYYFEDADPIRKAYSVGPRRTFGRGMDGPKPNQRCGIKVASDRPVTAQILIEVVESPNAKKPEDKNLLLQQSWRGVRAGRVFECADAGSSGVPAASPNRPTFEQQYVTLFNPNPAPMTAEVTGYFKGDRVKSVNVSVPAERVKHFEAHDIGLGHIDSYKDGRFSAFRVATDKPAAVLQSRVIFRNNGGPLDKLPIKEAFNWMIEPGP